MRRKIKFSKQEIKIKGIILLFLAAILVVSCVFFSKPIENFFGIGKTEKSGSYVSTEIVETSDMVIHYIDVGQADCTLIELPDGATMLIDAGDIETKQEVSQYIQAVLGTKNTIDHFVLTHSDSDHVGGAAQVLADFEVINIYRPFALAGDYSTGSVIENFTCIANEELSGVFNTLKIENETVAGKLPRITTTVYENYINAIYAEKHSGSDTPNSNITVNYDGLTIEPLDSTYDYEIEFYAPLKTDVEIELTGIRTKGFVTKGYGANSPEGKNAISPVIRLEYKDVKLVFTGDITDKAEEDVLESLSSTDREELSNVTVYQAGHHGASNSNSQDFLNLLSPKYTVVSSNNKGNEYGHPTPEFLERLEKVGHDITDYLLRTDQQGNILFGISSTGEVVYAANVELENTVFEVEWWQICIGIFVVVTIILFNIKIPQKASRK